MEIAAANFKTFPPFMGFSDQVFNPHTFRLEPFTIIPIAPIGSNGQAPLIPVEVGSDLNFTQFTIMDLRMQIKALLYAEEPQDSRGVQPQTAYELALKQQNLALKIGPLFSRLEQELGWPLIRRFAYILHTMGILPYPETNGQRIRFKYRSPLSLIKGQNEVAKFIQYVQTLQGIMGPQATQLYINPKTTPYLIAKDMQINPEFLNKPDDVARTMQKVKDQHDAQQAAQASGMMPQQPQNPSQQVVDTGG
jgi:hypothetical protein